MTSVDHVWTELSAPWRRVFTEAWASYCEGNLGIGAVLVDPSDGAVVASGRNRVNTTMALPRTLNGNFMAHAEMNALAALDRFKADGLVLYTSLQPCLMCAATAIFMHVETVQFAATDEYFADLDQLWGHHPYSERNKPTEIGPLEPPLSTFARLLPLMVQAASEPDGSVLELARREIPGVAALATSPAVRAALADIAQRQGTAEEALDALMPHLDQRSSDG